MNRAMMQGRDLGRRSDLPISGRGVRFYRLRRSVEKFLFGCVPSAAGAWPRRPDGRSPSERRSKGSLPPRCPRHRTRPRPARPRPASASASLRVGRVRMHGASLGHRASGVNRTKRLQRLLFCDPRRPFCRLEVAMADLFWLSDEPWAMIEPFMPRDQPGPERKGDRQIISLRGPSVPASCTCSPPAAAGAASGRLWPRPDGPATQPPSIAPMCGPTARPTAVKGARKHGPSVPSP